jgi:8-oxo-dGTP diphosphatase
LGLPGAFRKADEDLDDTARRALELVNVRRPRKVEQIGTSADSEMVTVTYMATIDRLPMTSGHSTSTAVIPFTELSGSRRGNSPLQGQDSQTLDRAVEEVKVRLDSTPLALGVVPPVFTLGQLRSIYEDAWGKKLDHRNFRRKLLEGPKPFVKPVGASLSDRGTKGRPPELYEATREWNHETPIRLPRKRPRSTQ